MAITNNNKRVLDLKIWQPLNPVPTASAAGAFLVKDPLGIRRTALYVASSTAQYYYAVDEDSCLQLPSMALGGTFGAESCGAWCGRSNTVTATGGTTTTLTTTATINSGIVGRTITFLTGSNAGLSTTGTVVSVVPGGVVS